MHVKRSAGWKQFSGHGLTGARSKHGISLHDFQRVTETSPENPRPPVPHGVLITGTQWRRSLETLCIARQLGLEPNTFTGTVIQSVLSSLVMSSYFWCCATATFVGIIKHVCQGCSLQDVDRRKGKGGTMTIPEAGELQYP